MLWHVYDFTVWLLKNICISRAKKCDFDLLKHCFHSILHLAKEKQGMERVRVKLLKGTESCIYNEPSCSSG